MIKKVNAMSVMFCGDNRLFLRSFAAVTFIDTEYGAVNFACFDIANHWCEWTGEQRRIALLTQCLSSSIAGVVVVVVGFELNWTQFPSKEQQTRWCTEYLTALKSEFF